MVECRSFGGERSKKNWVWQQLFFWQTNSFEPADNLYKSHLFVNELPPQWWLYWKKRELLFPSNLAEIVQDQHINLDIGSWVLLEPAHVFKFPLSFHEALVEPIQLCHFLFICSKTLRINQSPSARINWIGYQQLHRMVRTMYKYFQVCCDTSPSKR